MNEKSALLGSYVDNDKNNNNKNNDNDKESLSRMKKVTHNDNDVEDYQTLLGSTSMLKNSIDHHTFTKQQRRNSAPSGFTNNDSNDNGNGISSKNNNMNGGQNKNNNNGVGGNDGSAPVFTRMSMLYKQQITNPTTLYLQKIKTSFFEDAKSLAEGTIPQSVVLAIVIGIVCGIACYLYYSALFFALEYLWTTLPEEYVIPSDYWSPDYYWLWIPLVSFSMTTLVGLTVVYMGEPGDLPYTISRVHSEAYIPMNHVTPMVFASLFSILGEF